MFQSIYNDIRFQLQKGDVLSRLILINVAVFLIFGLFHLTDRLFRLGDMLSFYEWFMQPSDPYRLLLRPWTVISYMFLHKDLFHLLANMIMLYLGGRIFTDLLGQKRIFATYIAGGLAGSLLYLLAYNFIPFFENQGIALLMGASAAVLGIFFTIAMYVPDYEIELILFGRVRIKYLALVILLFDLFSMISENSGGHIAHLGGALFGALYANQLKKGNDFPMRVQQFFGSITNLFTFRKKQPVLLRKEKRYNPAFQEPVSRAGAQTSSMGKPERSKQDVIDDILDKISRSGYDSLTKEEKETIFKISRED